MSNGNVRRRWEECPREAAESRWATLYATLNREGDIVISRFTHEALGAPDAYQLLFERDTNVIGLKPARLGVETNAYPARVRGRHGGRRIRGYRLCREFGVRLNQTVRFHRCHMNHQGILILDLTDTLPASKRQRY